MKYRVTVVVNTVYYGEVEAENREEAYTKMSDELSYYSFDDCLEFKDENIDMYFDEA